MGREKTFPEALIKGINERGRGDVMAEYIKLGGVKHDDPPKYDLVIDRISHEVPFYRATLKRLAPDAKSFYFVCLNRSFVDGLTGIKGLFIRGTVTEKSRQSLARYLANAKRKVEAEYKRRSVG